MCRRTVSQDVVNDWNDIGQALARACATSQHIRFIRFCLENCLPLVGVKEQSIARVVRVGLVDPEDLGALGMKRAIRHKLVNRAPWQKSRTKLQQRLGPGGP